MNDDINQTQKYMLLKDNIIQGFYSLEVHGSSIPAEAIPISDEL